MCKKIHSYHQKNLRNNIKVKVHKEYCDEIFFLQFLSHYWSIMVIFCKHLPFSIILSFVEETFLSNH